MIYLCSTGLSFLFSKALTKFVYFSFRFRAVSVAILSRFRLHLLFSPVRFASLDAMSTRFLYKSTRTSTQSFTSPTRRDGHSESKSKAKWDCARTRLPVMSEPSLLPMPLASRTSEMTDDKSATESFFIPLLWSR